MANNIKGAAPNAIVAKETISFAAAGVTVTNTEIVYLVDDPLKSYVPNRAINGISGFEAGKGYYLVAKIAFDLEAYVVPPLTSGGGGSGDADADAYVAAVEDSGGRTLTPTEENTILTFITALKSASVWTKLGSIHILAWGTAAANKFNLKNPLDTDAAHRLEFTGGLTHAATGIKGDGSSGIIDSNFNPSTHATQNDLSYGAYLRVAPTVAGRKYFGGHGSAGADTYNTISSNPSTGNLESTVNSAGADESAINTTASRLMVNSRLLSTQFKQYRNGTLLFTKTSTSKTPLNLNLFWMCWNNNGTGTSFSDAELSLVFSGGGLTDGEVTSLNTAVNNLMTSLGINV